MLSEHRGTCEYAAASQVLEVEWVSAVSICWKWNGFQLCVSQVLEVGWVSAVCVCAHYV